MTKTTTPASPTLLNRELSWLDFNERVLELAADESMPLLERVKFCAIFSSNLDEFFMVRVAGLMDQAASGLPVRSHDGLTPREALAAIRARVEGLTGELSRLWKKVVTPALAAEGIHVGRVADCQGEELAELDRLYQREIFPVLTPLGVGPGQPFPYISGLSLSLGVLARDPDTGEERFARVKVPEQLPRFIAVGEGRLLLPLEDVIGHYLDSLFPGMEIVERAVLPRHARRRHGALRRGGRPARGRAGRDPAAPLRRRRARRGRLVDVGRDGGAAPHRPARRRRGDLRRQRHARPLRGDADRGARPARS